jgi:hypothetical protein
MMSFQSSTWADVEALRAKLMGSPFDSVETAAQQFAQTLAASCPTTILARVFLALPLSRLSPDDRRFASDLVRNDPELHERTSILCLLGTAGRETAWCDRTRSVGHRAIPLLGAAFVQGIPMIAKLLVDLDVNFASLEDGKVLDTRRLLGGRNAAFFVSDARTTEDSDGRQVIPGRAFVDRHGARTVFGMGGAYVDGTLAVAIVFTSEVVDRRAIDRFLSLISNFKMATGDLLQRDRIYRNADRAERPEA